MSKIPFSISDRSLTFYVDGQPYSIDRTAAGWNELKYLIQTDHPDVDRLISLTNPVQALVSIVTAAEVTYLPKGLVGVTRNAITYNGDVVTDALTERIFDLLAEGFDIQPWVRFMENLYMNPADFARDELYLWIAGSDLPITEDGHFLAYKLVRADYKSIHDGKTDNTPGTTVSMPRTSVDPVRDHLCSTGLHFCSKSYLPEFGDWNKSKNSANVVVLLKINPADVVSIPSDYNNAKGRAWKYEVLEEVSFDIPTKTWGAVYITDAPLDEDDYNDDYDDGPDLLQFPSDLASTLYAALNEIGVSTQSGHRDARIEWANWALYDLDEDFSEFDFIESFGDLTIYQAGLLVDHARSVKAEHDAETEDDVNDAVQDALDASQAAEATRVAAINSYGIETLRRKASKAGLPKAYTGHKVADLRKYLIDNHVV